jgi:uncharacterized membrane protein YccC
MSVFEVVDGWTEQTASRTRDWASSTASRIGTALYREAPAVLFGLRLWASVCLALYIAFWLQLDNAYWAATSAAVVCQPRLGASLRKAWFRVIGTTVGATAAILLTASFPQDRVCFLAGLALWGGACRLVGANLRNYAQSSTALAGWTAAIIATDELGSVGGASGDVFNIAVARASEICIGLISAGIVLAGTDFGGARSRLTSQLANISAEIVARVVGALQLSGREQSKTRSIRRELVRRAMALDASIDEALGESPELRLHVPRLQRAVAGLLAALSAWRCVSDHLELLQSDPGRREAAIVSQAIPLELRATTEHNKSCEWTINPSGGRRASAAAARALTRLPADTPSLRLLADRFAEAMVGVRHALDGLLSLVEPTRAPVERTAWIGEPDRLSALLDAIRISLAIGMVELFWIGTAWPGGAGAIVWTMIAIISLIGDQAYKSAVSFVIGACVACCLAAVVKFAILPGITTFFGLSLAIGLFAVPIGALTFSRKHAVFKPMAPTFFALVSPANQMDYDVVQFYNAALVIVVGAGAAALAFVLLPPLSPAFRVRRLLSATLHDLRRLADGSVPQTAITWEGLVYGRLTSMPGQANPLERAQLLAALSVGSEIIRLHRATGRLNGEIELNTAFDAVARGDMSVAIANLAQLDRRLVQAPNKLRVRSIILAMSSTLKRHASYFESGP